MKENLDTIIQNLGPQMVMYSIIVSIVIGLALLLAGFLTKKKEKDWWIFLTLIGAAAVIVNAVRLISSR